MQSVNIILLGGDRREFELYRLWRESGLNVKLAGFEKIDQVAPEGLAGSADLVSADVIIAPLSGISASGSVSAIFSAENPLPVLPILHMPRRPYKLLTGSASPELKSSLPEQARLTATADDPELALLNAVPTAEGTIQKAIELSDITLHGSRALIIGLGRCGIVLARVLIGIGARVTAAVRRSETAALAYTMGMKAVLEDGLKEAVPDMDFIFNTAPAPVLTAPVLQQVKENAVILDLASAPGGTDFEAAKQLGLRALLLPGIPGKTAPLTAARILSTVYRRLIAGTLE